MIFNKINKKWKGFGMFSVMVTLTLSTYYNLILAYSLHFLWKSFYYPLPWVSQVEDDNATSAIRSKVQT